MQNGVGLWSNNGSSDGIRTAADCSSVSAAKALPDGVSVRLSAVITSSCNAFGDYIYVEDQDRTAGIKVAGISGAPMEDQTITIIGTLATANGERLLTGPAIQ